MLLKNPESTRSRPVISRVARRIKSFETMPSSVRSSKTFQDSRPRMEIEEPGQRITFARDGLNECGLSAAVGAEDGDVFARADAERNVVQDLFDTGHYADMIEGN